MKKKSNCKRVLSLLIAVCILLTGVFLSPETAEAAAKKIVLTKSSASVTVGKTTSVKVKKVTGLKSKAVTYKSSNKKIATVSSKGVVTGKKIGTAMITVRSKENKKVIAKFKITVKKAAVKKITLEKTSASVAVGKTTAIKVRKVTGLKSKAVIYKSSNQKVATVSSKGVVLGKKTGTATITVSSKENKKVTAKFKVTVKKAPVKKELKLQKASTSIYVGKKETIVVSSVKGLKSKAAVYRTADSKIATVSSKGVVTGKKAGTTTITVSSKENKNVTAKFKVTVKKVPANTKYTIKFNGNGANGISHHSNFNLIGKMDSINCVYGKSYKLPHENFERDGYAFTGWNTKANGSGKFFKDEATVKNLTTKKGGTIILYAQWKKAKSVRYWIKEYRQQVDGSYKYFAKSWEWAHEGEKVTVWDAIGENVGDDDGWGYYVADATSIVAKEDAAIKIYYGLWDLKYKGNKYTIHFDGAGANGSMKDMVCEYGKSYKLPKVTFDNGSSEFISWAWWEGDKCIAIFQDRQEIENLTIKDGAVVILRAQWW